MALVPVANVTITAYRSKLSEGEEGYAKGKTAVTDLSGNWEITGLFPGNYVFKAEDADGMYAVTYFTVGSVRGIALADVIAATISADTIGVDVELYSGYTASGTVEGEEIV